MTARRSTADRSLADRTRTWVAGIGVLMMLSCTGAPPAAAADCSVTSVGLTPINDLGAGSYQGEQGGLYPEGANLRPAVHDAAGIAIGRSIAPIGDHVVMVSIGMSNTAAEFLTFIELASGDPRVHPDLMIVNCAQPGQDITAAANPNSSYWTTYVPEALAAHGLTMEQVQIAWLKQAKANPQGGFIEHAGTMHALLRDIAVILEDKFPNIKLAYVSSRIYAGYATSPLNPEPYAYEIAFSVKWLIEDQIGGDPLLNYDPDRGAVGAPWLSWGPYMWADGLVPRSDGLIWECGDLANDGTHPSASGRDKVANMLFATFSTDPSATPWFLAPTSSAGDSGAPPALRVLAARPNPFSISQSVPLVLDRAARVRAAIYDVAGRRLRIIHDGPLPPGARDLRWDGRTDEGARVAAGIYTWRIDVDGADASTRRTVVLR